MRELFEIHHGRRLTKADRVIGETPFLTAGQENQGVACYIGNDWEQYINPITVDMFGNCFFHNGIYSGDDNIYFFTSDKLSNRAKLFIANCIAKETYGKYSYGKQFRQSNADNLTASLPTRNGQIDFDFMEAFIAELEAYLSVTGLKDTHLSFDEGQALLSLKNNEIIFEEYKLTDIFDVKNSGNILAKDIVENSGATPYLCASSENNAVSSYISYDNTLKTKGNCIFIGGKTFVVTYQENDFFSNDSHNLSLYLKNADHQTKYTQLYLATCIYKSLNHKYSWGNSISNKKAQTDYIFLPTKNGKVDYACMNTLISAIHKLVIKDVVIYADKKIKATKDVVGNRNQ